MAAHFAFGTERQLGAAVDHVLRISRVGAVFVDDPALGNGFVLAQCDFDFAVSHGAGRHVDDDGRFFKPGNAMAIGFVPSIRSAPHSGATSLVVFVIAQPIKSASNAFKG